MAAPPLVDHLGRDIDFSVLKQEIAAPMMGSVRSILAEHSSDGLTPPRLASILRQAETGDAIAYLALAEQMEEKDLHYRSVLGTRKNAVSQLKISVQAASDSADDQANADLIEGWLARDELEEELFDVLDAVGKGFSLTEIIWDLSSKQWMPRCLEWRDPRWFRFDPFDGVTPQLRDNAGFLELPAYKFIYHRSKTKSGVPIRGGLARPVTWAWMFKNFTIKDWVSFAEVFGMPLRVGRYEVGETQDNIRKLMQAVSNIGSDAAAVIAKSMEIEFIDAAKGAGSSPGQLYKDLASFLDQQISKVVLGQTATTDAIAGGHAVGKTHDQVRGDLKRSDKAQLQATLNRDLVRPIIDLNRGPPASGVYPRLLIEEEEDPLEVGAMATALAALVPLGLRVRKEEVNQRLGFTDPDEGDEVLAPPSAAPPAPAEGGPTPSEEAQAADVDDVAHGVRTPQGGVHGPRPRPTPASGFSQLLTGAEAASGGNPPTPSAPPDAIDRGIDAALDDWRPLAEGLVQPVRDLVDGAASLEDLRDKLVEAIGDMDVDALADLLARAGFNARLAGIADQSLNEDG